MRNCRSPNREKAAYGRKRRACIGPRKGSGKSPDRPGGLSHPWSVSRVTGHFCGHCHPGIRHAPGSGFEACQGGTNIALAHAKYQGLLPAFIVGVTDGHEMFRRFAQQKGGRNQDCCHVAPASILSILKELTLSYGIISSSWPLCTKREWIFQQVPERCRRSIRLGSPARRPVRYA